MRPLPRTACSRPRWPSHSFTARVGSAATAWHCRKPPRPACGVAAISAGRIINLGTTILGATTANHSVYAGSKAPLEDFTRALALELRPRGITVNTIVPGPVDTSFYHGQETAETAANAARRMPAQRLGKVDDIVPLVAFLASPQSQWVTAQTISSTAATWRGELGSSHPRTGCPLVFRLSVPKRRRHGNTAGQPQLRIGQQMT